jgi:hypothetical protein
VLTDVWRGITFEEVYYYSVDLGELGCLQSTYGLLAICLRFACDCLRLPGFVSFRRDVLSPASCLCSEFKNSEALQ